MKRILQVLLVGLPNVGKSTLANALSGKVHSISSHRSHTTKHKIHSAFVVKTHTQIVLIDTPGKIQEPANQKSPLHTIWVTHWRDHIIGSPQARFGKGDGVGEGEPTPSLYTSNGARRKADGVGEEGPTLPEQVAVAQRRKADGASEGEPTPTEHSPTVGKGGKRGELNKPSELAPITDFDTIVVNKCDTAPRDTLLQVTEQLKACYPTKHLFALSARKNKGTGVLKEFLWTKAQKGNWLYSDQIATNLSEEELARQFTRQQLFRLLRQEVPYEVEIRTKNFTKKPKLWTISQQIISHKQSRKKIIVGKGGAMLKKIGIAASNNIQNHFGIRVNLFLEVL